MRLSNEPPEDTGKATDNKELPDNVKRVMEIQSKRTFDPPRTGNPLDDTSAPVTHQVMAPAGVKGPLPPQFQQASEAAEVLDKAPPLPTKAAAPPVHQQTAKVQEHTTEEKTKSAPKTRSVKPAHLDEKWQRVDFPSNLVPYPGINDIYLRSFTVPVLEQIYDAIEARNHTAYIDAMSKCISMDIRDLTVPDWIYAQYWIRISSFTRSPYTIRWTSKYGNEHATSVKLTDLKTVILDMQPEEYNEWVKKGFSFPTLRESEFMILNEDEESPDNNWVVQNAQYLYLAPDFEGDRMKEKIRLFRERGDVEFLTDIQDFAARTEHGVVESIKLRDEKFDAVKAKEFLIHSANQLRTLAKAGADNENMDLDNTAGIIALAEKAEEYETEAAAIQTAIDAGETYQPEEEVVVLRSIQPTDMFPNTYRQKSNKS
jgi:uncharacterized protein YqfB (UPF0267 family)